MKSAKEFNKSAVAEFVGTVMRHAANSFSKVTGLEVTASSIEFALTEDRVAMQQLLNAPSITVLVTPLLGDLAGRSYLLLTDTDITTILDCSPFRPSGGFDDTLRSALLKEVDNIISASVITEIANRFQIDLYGDVPELLLLKSSEAKELISDYVPNGQLSLVCSATLLCERYQHFAPKFIWKFSSAIVNQIENAQNQKV